MSCYNVTLTPEPELLLDYDEKSKQYPRISEYIVAERNKQEKELFKNPEK